MAIFQPPPRSQRATRGLTLEEPGSPGASLTWHALVIGVDSYLGKNIPQLQGCVNDAVSIRTFLVDRARVPAANIRFLLAPTGALPAGAKLATSQNVREALTDLTSVAEEGHQVFLYYAGHGVRIERATGARVRVYGFAPTDIEVGSGSVTNLILGEELNRALRILSGKGCVVTVVADTCHSGSSTRGPERGVRRIEVKEPLSDEAWRALVEKDPAPEAAASSRSITGAAGWIGRPGATDDWVFLSACCDTETAKEDEWNNEPHGLFTAVLLDALKSVAGDEIPDLRWMDFYPRVREGVRQRIRDTNRSGQTPTLEGRPEKTIFGGDWRPFEPGFTAVQRPATDLVDLDGGILHGLEPGAEIAIYPRNTASFAVADADAVPAVHARIESAAPATSTARLLTPGAQVEDAARARLVKPGASTPPMGVVLTDVPAEVVQALAATPGAAELLALDPSTGPLDVEVRPWSAEIPSWAAAGTKMPSWVGQKGGWVIVPHDPAQPETREIIAYLPPLDAKDIGGRASFLGQALGLGLLHWARYLRVRNRQSTDPTLARIVEVALRVAPASAPDTPPASCERREPDSAGVHDILDGEAVWIELHVKKAPKERLYTGILVCSEDGNIVLTWPPNGSSPAMGAVGEDEAGFLTTSSETVFVGLDRFNPAFPQRRVDQESSRYTFKIVAYTAPDGEPPRLASLAQDDTVQDVIVRAVAPNRRNLNLSRRPSPPPATPLWCTWDLVVRATGGG